MQHRIRRSPRRTWQGTTRRSAFTLLEVMLVLVIIAAIAGIAVVNIGGIQASSYKKIANAQISTFKNMLDAYKLEMGSYPAQLSALHEMPSDLADPSRYVQQMKEPIPADPWGRAYEYKLNGAEYEIRCLGPDGQSGNEDDITS